MSASQINCPSCGESIELTEVLAGPMLEAERKKADATAERRFAEERKAIEQAVAVRVQAEAAGVIADLRATAEAKDADVRQAREAELAARKAIQEAEQIKQNVELEVSRRVAGETEAAVLQAREAITQQFAGKLKAAEVALSETDAKRKSAEEAELAARRAIQEAEQAKHGVELEVARRIAGETEAAALRARQETTQQFAAKLKAAEVELAETDAKRQAAEQAELAALKAKRDAEETVRTVELTVSRRLDEERAAVREQVSRERQDEYRLKIADKDKQLADLKTQLDELQRKAEQGSQQLSGEVLEVDLLDALTNAFPMDRFERNGKGQRGADFTQSVIGPGGLVAGSLYWEAKRTKAWSDAWLPKLREDQRAANADIAVIATEAMPAGVTSFDCVDGVWVTSFSTVVPLASALRQGLVEVARARRAAAGADQKKDLVYDYLTGPEFGRRVAGLLEPIVEIRSALESERRTMTKQWGQRGKQIERMALGVAGMFGDLQGLIGPSLPEVEGLTLVESPPDTSADAARLELGDGTSGSNEVH